MAEEFVDRDTFLNRKTWWALRNTVLACIIRERPASDEFAWQKIAWEDEGSVKLLCGTWRQALQAYTIKAATILGRGFPLLSVGSGENGNSSGERCRFTQLMHPVPSPCAGRSSETGTIAAGAQPCAVPRPSPAHPVSGSFLAVSRPALLRNRCPQHSGAVPASAHRPRRSATHETDWPRSGCNWCGRFPWRAIL